MVGGIEIEKEIKVQDNWKLLRLRLNEFADMVRDLWEIITVDAGLGASYKVGCSIVSDAHNRLMSFVSVIREV